MSFNDNVQIDSGRVGGGGSGGGGGFGGLGGGGGRGGGIVLGGGGGILMLILALIFGPQVLNGGGSDQSDTTNQQSSQVQGGDFSHCKTGADANKYDDCRVIATVESLDAFWKDAAPEAGVSFRQPKITLFSRGVSTGCGQASSSTGPFYCPSDETGYFDTTFFAELAKRYGGSDGPLAQEYIVAHEYGHHIQNLQGNLGRNDQGDGGGGVRTELQADCYAGLWAGHAANTVDPETGQKFLKPLTQQDIADALAAAQSVGDDNIQSKATGQITPDTWTHGSSAQRKAWFIHGYQSQKVSACDTFSAADVNNPGS